MNTKELTKDSMLYDLVVSFACEKDDYISTLLVNDYQNYLLNCRIIDEKGLEKYNQAMLKLVTDSSFYKYVSEDYDKSEYFIEDTRTYIINKYNEYFNIREEKDYISRWI